jgi:hypothetical protein
MSAQLGLVLHVQEGNGELTGWFSNPESGASSTYQVMKDGRLFQFVESEYVAWAQGAGNVSYQSVESEGYVGEPLTVAAERALADLYHWGHETFGWPDQLSEEPGQYGFGWHGMGGSAWGGHTGCPGELRKNRRRAILDDAFGGWEPAPPQPEEDHNMIATDALTGGVWIAQRSGAVYAEDGAPYLGGCNNAVVNAGNYPCIGIDAYGDGYVLVLDYGEPPQPADLRYRTYHFPRDGSGRV